jgi:hypothetical protein
VALLLGALLGTSYAALGANESETIYACVYDNSGIITRVRVGTPYDCPKGYSLIAWNSDGQVGEAGPAGAPGMVWRGAWDSTATYQSGDAVFYDGSSFIAVSASTNEQPDTSPAAWNLIAEAGQPGIDGADGADGGQNDVTLSGFVNLDGSIGRGTGFSVSRPNPVQAPGRYVLTVEAGIFTNYGTDVDDPFPIITANAVGATGGTYVVVVSQTQQPDGSLTYTLALGVATAFNFTITQQVVPEP